MTPDEPNKRIAEAISPDRTGWAWEKCPVMWHPLSHCPHCHGTGRVPIDFGFKQNMPDLVEWAAQQEWWDCEVIGPVSVAVAVEMNKLQAGVISADTAAKNIRDLIAEVLKENSGE